VFYLHKYSHGFSNFNDIVIQLFQKMSVMTVATLRQSVWTGTESDGFCLSPFKASCFLNLSYPPWFRTKASKAKIRKFRFSWCCDTDDEWILDQDGRHVLWIPPDERPQKVCNTIRCEKVMVIQTKSGKVYHVNFSQFWNWILLHCR